MCQDPRVTVDPSVIPQTGPVQILPSMPGIVRPFLSRARHPPLAWRAAITRARAHHR
jgi:hypothetical protein